MNKKILAICSLFSVCAAFGAGFQILEQGASNMGTSNAGAVVNANNDATAAFWNPSAASFMDLEVGEFKFDFALNIVIPNFELNDVKSSTGGSNGGNAGCTSAIPNFYTVYKYSEDLTFTLSGTSTYGLATEYGYSDWAGQYLGLKSDLFNMDINPSVSYKITDKLSISGGISVQYMNAELTQSYAGGNYSRVNGHGFGVGGNIGITYEYADDGRVGFHWRSEVHQELEGSMYITNNATGATVRTFEDIVAATNVPHTFNVGVYQRLRGDFDRLAVMMDYTYTLWSSFDYLDIVSDSAGTLSSTYENWKNTSKISFGIHYYPTFDENMVFRFGTAWDESPIKSAEYRTVRIPDSDRIWLSCGVGYKWGIFNFDLAYMYIFMLNSNIDQDDGYYSISGYYTGNAHVVSAQIGVRW